MFFGDYICQRVAVKVDGGWILKKAFNMFHYLNEGFNFQKLELESLSERRKKMSLSVTPNVVASSVVSASVATSGAVAKGTRPKPAVPAKPAHIRPGLKPVKIPTVDDKVLVSCCLFVDVGNL